MQLNKIKLALGFAAAATMAMPMVASAAADQEKAMKNANNWAHPRGQHDNQAYSKLTQINKGNVKNLKAAWTFATGVNRCLLYTSPSPRDVEESRMPSSA